MKKYKRYASRGQITWYFHWPGSDNCGLTCLQLPIVLPGASIQLPPGIAKFRILFVCDLCKYNKQNTLCFKSRSHNPWLWLLLSPESQGCMYATVQAYWNFDYQTEIRVWWSIKGIEAEEVMCVCVALSSAGISTGRVTFARIYKTAVPLVKILYTWRILRYIGSQLRLVTHMV